MTTNYHVPIEEVAEVEAAGALWNSRFSSLDSQLTTVTDQAATTASEMVGARGGYDSLDARLANLVIAGGNVATLTNGTAAAGQKTVTVDSTAGFVAGAYVAYSLNGGNVEYNQIDAVTDGTHLLLTDNIGTGGILNDTYISMISSSEYQAANAINHGSQELTLREAMIYAAGDVHNVIAYGAAGDGVTDDLDAIQMAIDAAKVNGGVVLIPAGTYRIDGSLDLCNTSNVKLQGASIAYPAETAGTVIECRNTNGAAIEIIGSHAIELADLQIKGHTSSTPAVGVWTGRSAASGSGANTSIILFRRVSFYGAFTKTAVYNCGCESNIFHNCYIYVTNAACQAGLMWDWENSLALTPEHSALDTSYAQAMCAVHNSFITCDAVATAFSPIRIINEPSPIVIAETYLVAYGAPIYYVSGACHLIVRDDAVEQTPTHIVYGNYQAGASNTFRFELLNCGGPVGSSGYAVYFEDNTEVRDSLIQDCHYLSGLRFYNISLSRIEHWSDYNESTSPELGVANIALGCYFEIGPSDTYSCSVSYSTTVAYTSDILTGYALLPGLAVDQNGAPGATGQALLTRILTASKSWTPSGPITDGSSAATTVSLTGPIRSGAHWFALASYDGISAAGWEMSCYVLDSEVDVRITNRTGSSQSPSGTLRIIAIKVA